MPLVLLLYFLFFSQFLEKGIWMSYRSSMVVTHFETKVCSNFDFRDIRQMFPFSAEEKNHLEIIWKSFGNHLEII